MMIKTIFYKPIEIGDEPNHWFNNKQYKEWFTIPNYLYEPNGSVTTNTIIKHETHGAIFVNVAIIIIQDKFSDEGITRKITLSIAKE